MDELINKIARAPLIQKVGVLLGLVVLLAVGHYFLIYQEQDQKTEKLARELRQARENLLQKKAIADNLSKFTHEVERLNLRLKEALALLPNKSEIPELLRKIAELGEKSGLELVRFEPQEEVPYDFYAEVPVVVRMTGSYHEIAVFMDKVGQLNRIINMHDLKLITPEIRNKKVVVKAEAMATTYRFIEKEELAGSRG